MNAIGGYFGFENNDFFINRRAGKHYQQTKYVFDCGRSALDIALATVKPEKIYVPYYTCDALLQPLQKRKIPFSFYSIDDKLEIADTIELKKKELIIYVNYFGLKNFYSGQLIKKYKDQLVLDNTMAFFFKNKTPHWSFNSCRKFFGVPDGSYLRSPKPINKKLLPDKANNLLNTNFLFLRNEQFIPEGYREFIKNEDCFGKETFSMSQFSMKLLSSLDYKKIIQKRDENFSFLQSGLKNSNTINAELISSSDCAMFYPYLPKKAIPHQKFWSNDIFIPRLWTDCADRSEGFSWEKKFSATVLPLPIDHRYSQDDLKRILKLIL